MTIWIVIAVIILVGQVTFAALFWIGKEGEREHPIYREQKSFNEMQAKEISCDEVPERSAKRSA